MSIGVILEPIEGTNLMCTVSDCPNVAVVRLYVGRPVPRFCLWCAAETAAVIGKYVEARESERFWAKAKKELEERGV